MNMKTHREAKRLRSAIQHLQKACIDLCYVSGVAENRIKIESLGIGMELKLKDLVLKGQKNETKHRMGRAFI